jgi:hypothetical protein
MWKPNYILLNHTDKDPIKVHMQAFLYIFYVDSININTRSRDDGSLLCMHNKYADAHQATKYIYIYILSSHLKDVQLVYMPIIPLAQAP